MEARQRGSIKNKKKEGGGTWRRHSLGSLGGVELVDVVTVLVLEAVPRRKVEIPRDLVHLSAQQR